MCGLVSWNDETSPPTICTEEFAKEAGQDKARRAMEALHARFPKLEGGLTEEACLNFLEGMDSRAAVVKCSSYVAKGVALLGDAAHSTGGTLGQVCHAPYIQVETWRHRFNVGVHRREQTLP